MSNGAVAPPPDPGAKEHLNFEGRVRAEKRKDVLVDAYNNYLAAHPEINPLLHDIMQHVLVHKPDHPLEAIRDYVKSRSPETQVGNATQE
ncbi:hypothetical protein ABB37_09191 [Leptomonas pyrrhocoris]|uniref:Uncharacterized protein n=1 Tax=Leptomonas pyrrhocoris TaxID=157538 RepID=A0A0N0DRD4_LEPPY|nr:hypothetical protein ABB37_09191 [Leptomonas pyrrhocoris]XP_015652981.1 hypothetical protein ABB37_09191 [Leptomonas pyrrhocoris]KPA74541.1 hypothetical protein ABB37_09191 [Leptomonas pyrrhocoris]KPA74542.1 hypothetical protein ABB37_09191 [Leptomonas pyrrhocoris]|eukprot:XP_015652980.1 hypothetical protein ABB37_09191 [Leptomonas pyrrhocoris]